jgi:phosphoribosylaminoimidazole carboxylase (NCAIR synthetase)
LQILEACNTFPDLLAVPDARLHLYGKVQTRAGRKMGHVTRLAPIGTGPSSESA